MDQEEDVVIFESGAIATYLLDQSGVSALHKSLTEAASTRRAEDSL